MILHLDYETRSACDLKTAGLHRYAEDPSTDVLCAAYAFDDEPVELWTPGAPVPKRIVDHIEAGKKVVGHNVVFEIEINNTASRRHGWPVIQPEQTLCTMVLAYSLQLPGSLEKAAPSVGIAQEKDLKGHRVMMQLSQPRDVLADGTVVWWDDPEKLQRLYAYCKQDVEVERALLKRLIRLPEYEQKVWNLDFKINSRGVQVDVAAARKALAIVSEEKIRLDLEMRQVTGNRVATCSASKQLTDFLIEQGVDAAGVAKADVVELLKGDLPDACRKALKLRQEAAKSSTAKIETMLNSVCGDGRMRGLFQYWGAGATGRWAGRRFQPHNLPRPNLKQKEIEEVFELMEDDCVAL